MFSLLLFNRVLEVPVTSIRQKEEIKGTESGKEELNLSLFSDDMTQYIKIPIDSTKKLLELINEFSKVAGYKNISRNQLNFYMPITN